MTKNSSLSGSVAEHARELKKLSKDLKDEAGKAKKALSKGNCGAAVGRLMTALYIAGEASAHAQESGRFVPKATHNALRSVTKAVVGKCIVAPTKKIRGRGKVIRGTF